MPAEAAKMNGFPYRTDIRGLLDELEAESKRIHVPLIDREDGAALAVLAFLAPSGLALDLGAGVGYSTAWIAVGASVNPGIEGIVAVERDRLLAARLRVNAERLSRALGVKIEVIEGDAIEYLAGLAEDRVGLAFVDVEKREYPMVLRMLRRRLVVGGIAAFHNAYTPRPPEEFFVEASSHGHLVVPTPQGLLVLSRNGSSGGET